MKKIITLLLIGILLISCSSCKNAPEFGDDSDIAMSEDDDDVDMQAENIKEKNANVPEVETVQPKQPENKKEPQPYNLNYTVKHDDSGYIYYGFNKDIMPEFPIVHIVDSTQKLSQVIEYKSVSCRFPQKIKYREKTDSTVYDYSKAKQEAAVTEFYNDAFFENKILVIVISNLSDYDIVADLNSVKSDGTVQIDLLNSKSRNYKTRSSSCCEYIELDNKYAGLNFKIKYNEVTIDKSIDTRDKLLEYPLSIDFKVEQLDISPCSAEDNMNCSHEITVIKSVEEFENFMAVIRRNHQSDNIKNDMINVYPYNNKLDFVNNKISETKVDIKKYYNEKFFKSKSIVVVFVSTSDEAIDHKVRSVTAGGIITYEEYIPIRDRYMQFLDVCYGVDDCDLIEIDKQYENSDFKTEFVKITEYEYKWRN